MYIELHARSAFSFLEGVSLPEELAAMCKDWGMPSMALLDRDGLYGSPRFHLAAKKNGMRAHIGAEVTCESGWRYPLLVTSRVGYQNLCRLITRMKLRAPKGEGAVAAAEVAEHAAGLICLTGGDEGPLAHALASGGIESATECIRGLCEMFWRRKCLHRVAAPFSAAKRRPAIRPPSTSSAGKMKLPLRRWPPMAFATRNHNSANCSTSLPASVITARSRRPGAFSRAIPNAT